ncbi:MAG TPA: ATP-binding cassette domain-containing protein [Rhodanobacteraceae bacterium]
MIEFAMRHALTDLALDIEFRAEARTLALFGDSGAGKTSVLNAIAGLLKPERGRVALDGRVLFDSEKRIDVPVTDRRIGYVFQDGRLFPHLDVRANLLYGARSLRTGEAANLDAVVALLELAPLLGRRPSTLSGGERQRVAIGRALLARPHALLLDEPLTGLHFDARRQVLEHLRRLKRELGVFTVLVTHHPDEVAALADQVVLLAAGEVVGRLSHAEFVNRHAAASAVSAD